MRPPLLLLSTALIAQPLLAPSAYAQRDIQYVPTHSKSEIRRSVDQTNATIRSKFNSALDDRAKASEAALSAFNLTIPGLQNGKPIPPRFAYCTSNGKGGTRDGSNISPGLNWSPPPKGTKSLVVLVVDKDVPASFEKANAPQETIDAKAPRRDFYHWVLVDIPPSISGLMEGKDSNGITPEGKPLGTKPYGISGQNDYALMSPGNHGGYDGPCPPWNDKRLHNYHFTVYALDIASVKLPSPIKGKQVELAMKDHILAQSEIVGVFSTYPSWVQKFREERKAQNRPKSKAAH